MVCQLFENQRKGGIMEFKKNQTIYMQIADVICEHILTGHWKINEKIASVREYASIVEVNPNTIMRTYTHLQDQGIIYNKRGIGFFVSVDAPLMIQKIEKAHFLEEEIPEFFKKMNLLKIDFAELEKLYQSHTDKSDSI